ncbi:AraC family ligand binding domain-containing protein [Escherichia coli]
MKGYILNLTIRGEGVIDNRGNSTARPGDMLLFPPGEIHHYGRHPDAREWYHQWVYFRPRAYWHEWLNWPTIFAQTGFFRPDEQWQARFGELFGQIVEAGPGNQALLRAAGDQSYGAAAAQAHGSYQRIAASAAG